MSLKTTSVFELRVWALARGAAARRAARRPRGRDVTGVGPLGLTQERSATRVRAPAARRPRGGRPGVAWARAGRRTRPTRGRARGVLEGARGVLEALGPCVGRCRGARRRGVPTM